MKCISLGGSPRRTASRAGLGATAAALTIAAGTGTAAADRIEVTTQAADGRGSFAAAIKKANRRSGGDQIRFAKGLRGKIDLPEETVTLSGKVVIAGNGFGSPEAKGFGRLELSGHRGGSELHIERGGKAALRGLYLDGVALQASRSALTVKDSFLTGERTVDQTGVSVGSGELRILRTTVEGFDQGISMSATSARVDESTIADNIGGGGILVGNSSDADVSSSTISGNVVEGLFAVGGGLSASGYASTARVVNSTIVRNQAIGDSSAGGGLAGDVEVNSSTVVANRAATGAGIAGGLRGDADVGNSILYGNETFDGSAADCARPFTSGGGNVIGAPGECLLDGDDVSGVDPLLGPLSDNGGPTETMAIGAGSPAVGLAVRSTAAKFDQRGVRRGRDPDSGAYER